MKIKFPSQKQRRIDSLEKFRRHIPSICARTSPVRAWLIGHIGFFTKHYHNLVMVDTTDRAVKCMASGNVAETTEMARILHSAGEWPRFDYVAHKAEMAKNSGLLCALWTMRSLGGNGYASHDLAASHIYQNNFEAAKIYFMKGHHGGVCRSALALYALYNQDKFADHFFRGNKIVGIQRNPVLALHYLTEAADMRRNGDFGSVDRLKLYVTIRFGASALIRELRETHPKSKVLQRAEGRFQRFMAFVDTPKSSCAQQLTQH